MRIMTYNIHSGRNMSNVFDIGPIGDVISEIGPDICALNEVRMRTADVQGLELARVLGEKCGMEWRFGRTIDINGGEYGNALLSRWPIIETECVDVPDVPAERRIRHFEHRGALSCVIDAPQGRLQAIVCHFGLSAEEANNAVETVISLKRGDMPVILMGDFNITPDSGYVRRLRAVFTDTAGEKPLTFSAADPHSKIDYILTAGGLVAGQLNTKKTLASDHLPVFCDMDFA